MYIVQSRLQGWSRYVPCQGSLHWKDKRDAPEESPKIQAKAAKIVAMSQPSSAAIERVFSLYRQLFSNNQGRALADIRTLSVQLKYHDRAC